MDFTLSPGLKAEVRRKVTPEITARHLGSGNVEVLATPAMIALMEQAAVQAVDPLLPEGQKTVGVAVDIRHIAPTPVGMEVRATAELLEIDGRKLLFRVEAYDEKEKVGEGFHRRVIVDIEQFAARISNKGGSK
ncbi:MAG: thioesterase family protein [Anaerolineae bacterium]|nr:thioesterase family protein [Anaerolineae bacterium]MDW8103013.1 thioesterase family protein [Anaerolineae bacterium]